MPMQRGLRWDKTNKQHYARVTVNGKTVKRYLGRDRTDALARFRQIFSEGSIAPIGPPPNTIAKGVNIWKDTRSPSLSDWARRMATCWQQYAAQKTITSIDSAHLMQYAEYLQSQKQSPQSVIHKVRAAHKIIDWFYGRGWCKVVPGVPSLPKPVKRPRDVPIKLLHKAINELPDRASRIIKFILSTGCRPGEACGLIWEDVDLEHGACVLSNHKKAKQTGKTRTVYLTKDAIGILESIEIRKEYVFLSRLHKPYTPNGIRSILRRRGIPAVYSLRHTFAQNMLENGERIEDVAKLLGHSDLRTVQTYAQVRDTRARQVASNLPSLLPPQPPSDTLPQTESES